MFAASHVFAPSSMSETNTGSTLMPASRSPSSSPAIPVHNDPTLTASLPSTFVTLPTVAILLVPRLRGRR